MGEFMKITYKTVQIQYYLDYLIEHCILAVTFFCQSPFRLAAVLCFGAVLWISKMIVNKKVDFKRTPFDMVIALLVILLAAISIWASPDQGF